MEGAATFIPTKPHFFKPLLQGFYQGLLIPVSFLKYLNLKKGADDDHDAVLRTECGEWKVKIKGWRFEGGWTEFAKHHDLHVGDFVVFKHQGNLVFDVSVFDPSTCRREYTNTHRKRETEMPLLNNHKRICVRGSKEEHQKEAKLAGLKAEASSLTSTYPSFQTILSPSSIRRKELYLPREFARAHGLYDRHREMITIIDGDREGQRSWQLTLGKSRTQVYLSRGWKDLTVAKALKGGDKVSFTLVENGERAVMVFNKIRETRDCVNKELIEEVVEPTVQHFTCEISPYILKFSGLYVPVEFAKSNGLSKSCQVTVTDPEQRQWAVGISFNKVDGSVWIQQGWRNVTLANRLKIGDIIKLERVNGGGKSFAVKLSIVGRSSGEKGIVKGEPFQ